jgi:hypothetical protein
MEFKNMSRVEIEKLLDKRKISVPNVSMKDWLDKQKNIVFALSYDEKRKHKFQGRLSSEAEEELIMKITAILKDIADYVEKDICLEKK